MGLRHRSIRLRVAILIVVPVLCLVALYGFAASITLGNALNEAHAKTVKDQLLTPLGNFEAQLYKERHLAILLLATPKINKLSYEYGLQQNQTRTAFLALEANLTSQEVKSDSSAHERKAIAILASTPARLSVIRAGVNNDAITMAKALQDYNTIVEDTNAVMYGVLDQQSSVPIVTQAVDVVGLDSVAQTTQTESDLLSGEIARKRFPPADRIVFAQLAAARSHQLAQTLPQLDPAYQKVMGSALTPALSNGLATAENAVIYTPWRNGPPPQIVSGSNAFGAYTAAITRATTKINADLQSRSQHAANDIFAELFLAAGLGLLGTIASVGLSLYIGRSLVRQLRNLRESALGLASEKLPSVIQQLRTGEAVDLSEYVASEETATRDEIEQVQHAFDVVQQTAVQAAVDEARLRRGISDVFRNLAGRSQSLLHRQLTLLDGMERRATEPDELEDLFRIDHLTTRMRRHAEGLIILSGETPARGWRQPVQLIDVLRAAVAEVEDYTRIRVLSRTKAAVAGHAVADVIHLVAELAENATVFSPPNTPVRIQGDIVGRGLAIEIEDRGLGISADRLAEINADLANPRQFDLSDSDRLGLFIAGQLARRHDIRVSLQPSVYGGTTAVVLIPTTLVVDEQSFAATPALETSTRPGLSTGRHAALAGAERGLLTTGNGHEADTGAGSLPVGDALPTRGRVLPGERILSGEAVLSGDQVLSDDQVLTGDQVLAKDDALVDDQRSIVIKQDGLPRRTPGRSPAGGLPRRTPAKSSSEPSDDLDGRITTAELAELGLPVRVRQANLAPQLRDDAPAATPAPAPTSGDTMSSPEEVRNTVSALQRGWQLGRAEADATASEPPSDASSTVHEDDPETSADPKPTDTGEDDDDQNVRDKH